VDVFLGYVPYPGEFPWDFSEVQYAKVGPVRVAGEVRNADRAIFTPCSHDVEIAEIFDAPHEYIQPGLITEIASLRGRFCEQLLAGERFSCQGTLERGEIIGEVHYRILLGNQPSDFLVEHNDEIDQRPRAQ